MTITKNEAEMLIREIARLQAASQQTKEDKDRLIKELQNEKEAKIEENSEIINEKIDALLKFFRANRDLATGKKDKKIQLASGTLIMYGSKASVSVQCEERAIQALKSLKLYSFIKTKETIDRTAIHANPGAVKAVDGLEVIRQKKFGVRPKSGSLVSKPLRKEGLWRSKKKKKF